MRGTFTKKLFTKLIIVIAFICILAFGVIAFARDVRLAQPVPGFTVFLENTDICSISIGQDEIWAGGSDGLYRVYKNGNLYASEKIGDYRYVKAILIKNDDIWIGHDLGLTILKDKKSAETFTKKEGLPDNRVNALCMDSKGAVWAGTWGGVAVFDDERIVRVIKEKDGLIDDMINVITQDRAGGMWFGSYVAPRGGLCVFYDNKWQYFTTKDDLLHSNINAVIQLKNNDVVAGGGLYTKGGGTIFSFRNNKWIAIEKIEKKNGLAGAKIRSLLEDSKKRLWIGSEYEGLAVLENRNSKIITTVNGLSNNEVKSIKEDATGTIWAGTRKGLVRIEKGGIENVR